MPTVYIYIYIFHKSIWAAKDTHTKILVVHAILALTRSPARRNVSRHSTYLCTRRQKQKNQIQYKLKKVPTSPNTTRVHAHTSTQI